MHDLVVDTTQLADDGQDAQARQRLGEMFGLLRTILAETAEPDSLPVAPGSSLAGDDRRLKPFELSNAIRSHLMVATDNLRALDDLIEKAQTLHPIAPFTLIRAASEAAATAAWMLYPASRDERVNRRLRVAWAHSGDRKRLHDMLERTGTVLPTDNMRVRLREVAASESLVLNRDAIPVVTTMVQDVDSAQLLRTGSIEWGWRIASSFTHARDWSAFLLDNTKTPSSRTPGSVTMKVTASAAHLVIIGRPCFDLIRWTYNTYVERSTSYLERRRFDW